MKNNMNKTESFLECFSNLENYNYYSDSSKILNFEEFNDKQCVEFIKKYFVNGGKGNIVSNICDYFIDGSAFRASHSVSIYLLGLVIYDNCECLKTIINQQIKPLGISDFKYIWFLICLHHDYCSYIEDKPNCNDYLSQQDVHKTLLEMTSSFFEGVYNNQNIRSYSDYRRNAKRFDHGISGGCMLNKGLRDNLSIAIKESKTKTPSDFVYKRLHWSDSHVIWYDFAASIIIKHNIWFVNTDRSSKDDIYKYEGVLDMLDFIISDKKRIKFADNPLLFIFFVLDTIEPIKIDRKNNKETLDKVLFHFCLSDDQFIISLYPNDKVDNDLYLTLGEKAEGMKVWMDLDVEIKADNKVVIIKWDNV